MRMEIENGLTPVFFLVIATVVSLGIGGLVKTERLPIAQMMAFSDRQWQFMRIWVKVALGIGAIVPLIMLIALWNEPSARQFLLGYLGVLVVQLLSEVSFSRWFFKSMVVAIGTLYTSFRIWQLWEGLHIIDDTQPWLGLVWLMLGFWVANLIMLVFMAIPSILPKSEQTAHRPS